MKNEMYEMNLQLFADEGLEEGTEENTEEGQEGAEESKTYTKEEVDTMLQKEADRRVSAALAKQEKKLENKLKEAEKLRNMDAEQKREYELEQRAKQIEEKEKEFALMENKIECNKILSNRGIPADFVDYVVAEDADKMMENIKTFEKLFKSAVSDAVNEKIEKKTPTGSGSKQKGLSRDEFKKMSIAQQSEIYRTNPELYKELTGQ